ncbi:MAG: HD-GYP domain-containing protein [Lachnospiraceae bacterium]|nr:HD-GYP domain-containing protein [Lachnospiraceae bacterium]
MDRQKKQSADNKNTKRTGEKASQSFSRSTREQIIYIIVLIMFVVISAFVCSRNVVNNPVNIIQADDNWITEDGQSVNADDLSEGSQQITKDVSGLVADDTALCFRSIDTEFTVYADGHPIYDYHPSISPRFGRSYGMNIHTVAVPTGTKDLSLKLDPVFPSVPADIDNIMITDSGHYMLDYFRKHLFSFEQSSITLLLGLFFLIVGLSSALMMRQAGIDFISFGITCMLIGFVGFNDTMLLQLLTGHPEMIRVVTYICLIFLPFPALTFFAGATGYGRSKLVSGMLILCLVNFAAQVLVTHIGISDYFYLVAISHVIIGISIVMAVWFVIQAKRHGGIRSALMKSVTVGLAACAAGVIIDLLRFHLFKSHGAAGFTRLGVLIFTAVIGFFLFREQTRAIKQKQIESMTLVSEITEAFARVIDMKDRYTNGHSTRVAKYTAMLAKELGYDDETVEKYYRIGLLHDVGKIGIPSALLNKPGKLTRDEYDAIKAHTLMGYEALKGISIIPELAVGAKSHHERPDGKGYPNGLSGDDIPRVAQIIAVADCFDAMYSDRPYRKRLEFGDVVSTIKEVSGTQLSPEVVEAFLRLVDKGEFIHPFDLV